MCHRRETYPFHERKIVSLVIFIARSDLLAHFGAQKESFLLSLYLAAGRRYCVCAYFFFGFDCSLLGYHHLIY